jgi:Sec-independent protein translocase protein TatA
MGGRPTTVGAGTANTSDLPSTRSPNQLTRLLRCTRRRFKRAEEEVEEEEEEEEEEDHQAEEDTSYRASLATVQYM